MDAEKLVKEFEACAALLNTPQGIYVMHQGREFADTVGSAEPMVSSEVRALLGIAWVKPVRCSTNIRGEFSVNEIHHHTTWMVREYRTRRFSGIAERGRWLGFIAGACSRGGFGLSHFRLPNLIDARDLPLAIRIAHEEKTPYHHTVHLWLGYLYGWLWATGKKSFDEFLEASDAIGEPVRKRDSRFIP